jgi:hypothetical protein
LVASTYASDPDPKLAGTYIKRNMDPLFMDATYVCFDCRKMIKKHYQGWVEAGVEGDYYMEAQPPPANVDAGSGEPREEYDTSSCCREKCPDCHRYVINVGPSFQMPKQKDDKRWRQQAKLAKAGYVSSPCDCFRVGNTATLAALGVDHPEEVK